MSKVILSEITTLGEQGTLRVSPGSKIDLSKTNSYLQLPRGTTAQRPSNATSGELRYNTDLKTIEYYDGTQWQEIEVPEDYDQINKAGLVFQLDASVSESYPGSGTKCFSIKNIITGDLLNGASVSNNSFIFDGSNDYIDFGSNEYLRNIGSFATIECWFKSTRAVGSIDFSLMVGWGDGTAYYSNFGIGNWYGLNPDESIFLGYNSAAVIYSERSGHSKYHDGNWHHAVATIGPNNHRIYVDGQEVPIQFPYGSNSYSVSNVFGFSSNTKLYVGLRPYGNGHFQGNIPIVNIYDRVLTPGEIWKNYIALAPRFEINPIPSIVTNGLVLNLDAANYQSYPRSGTTWTDLSGNGNNATISGATYSSLNGGCFDFDGINDFAEAPDSSTLDMETAWSIESWCRREGGAPAGQSLAKIISKWENYFLAVDFNNGADIYACVGTGNAHTCLAGGADRDNELPLNTWAHLMVTYSESSGTARIYYNGVQIESWAAPATASSNNPLCIGSAGTGTIAQNQYFNGKISVARVYNRDLTAQEVQQNFNALRTRYGI